MPLVDGRIDGRPLGEGERAPPPVEGRPPPVEFAPLPMEDGTERAEGDDEAGGGGCGNGSTTPGDGDSAGDGRVEEPLEGGEERWDGDEYREWERYEGDGVEPRDSRCDSPLEWLVLPTR